MENSYCAAAAAFRTFAAAALCCLTLELTGPLRQDGLARAEKMYRVPQAGPRRPAVAGPAVERGVRPQPVTLAVCGWACNSPD